MAACIPQYGSAFFDMMAGFEASMEGGGIFGASRKSSVVTAPTVQAPAASPSVGSVWGYQDTANTGS